MKEITKHYTNGEVTITWKAHVCQHSGRCFTGLPQVFDFEKRPWINPEGATTQQIIDQVKRCPSAALSTSLNSEGLTNE
ncbi:(4Fe-4S)-binding protein [soil metagenome]